MDDEGFRILQLAVGPGQRIAPQRHLRRAERWVIAKGTGVVTLEDERFTVAAGDTLFIPARAAHHLDNPSSGWLIVIEIQFGSYLADDDTDDPDDVRGVTN